MGGAAGALHREMRPQFFNAGDGLVQYFKFGIMPGLWNQEGVILRTLPASGGSVQVDCAIFGQPDGEPSWEEATEEDERDEAQHLMIRKPFQWMRVTFTDADDELVFMSRGHIRPADASTGEYSDRT